MSWLKRKKDPIDDRSKRLEADIASLERKIQKLQAEEQRSRATYSSPEPTRPIGYSASRPAHPGNTEPIFEEPVTHHAAPQALEGDAATRDLYNAAGLRKYDLVSLINRVWSFFTGSGAEDRKMINYLAAGSIHGLRPLRHEKRVARNRAMVGAAVLLFITWAIVWRLLQ